MNEDEDTNLTLELSLRSSQPDEVYRRGFDPVTTITSGLPPQQHVESRTGAGR